MSLRPRTLGNFFENLDHILGGDEDEHDYMENVENIKRDAMSAAQAKKKRQRSQSPTESQPQHQVLSKKAKRVESAVSREDEPATEASTTPTVASPLHANTLPKTSIAGALPSDAPAPSLQPSSQNLSKGSMASTAAHAKSNSSGGAQKRTSASFHQSSSVNQLPLPQSTGPSSPSPEASLVTSSFARPATGPPLMPNPNGTYVTNKRLPPPPPTLSKVPSARLHIDQGTHKHVTKPPRRSTGTAKTKSAPMEMAEFIELLETSEKERAGVLLGMQIFLVTEEQEFGKKVTESTRRKLEFVGPHPSLATAPFPHLCTARKLLWSYR
ncbi:hypothetical protein BOTBODRAFT_461340 [Botryobasidium botryosum FD-172 SS1]|uniref:Uncharacterized protein n=1 Tax=Botryobasidium botryosum (strain FD-172 SS1) TaxID=930990 RepID=A0A067M6J7_BOTB1|nr:hypothetical protein BOTBODRAFT_461340 [Botryobasidium botryosum FD-172 SS1]